jgi:hypothetical protein
LKETRARIQGISAKERRKTKKPGGPFHHGEWEGEERAPGNGELRMRSRHGKARRGVLTTKGTKDTKKNQNESGISRGN